MNFTPFWPSTVIRDHHGAGGGGRGHEKIPNEFDIFEFSNHGCSGLQFSHYALGLSKMLDFG